jgi:hypothetical protein
VDDSSTSPHILTLHQLSKTQFYVALDSYNSVHMTKSDKIRLVTVALFFAIVIGLVIYNSIVYGIAKYPHDGM